MHDIWGCTTLRIPDSNSFYWLKIFQVARAPGTTRGKIIHRLLPKIYCKPIFSSSTCRKGLQVGKRARGSRVASSFSRPALTFWGRKSHVYVPHEVAHIPHIKRTPRRRCAEPALDLNDYSKKGRFSIKFANLRTFS